MKKDSIWGIVLIAISIFLIIVEIRTIRRQGKQKRQCTMHTQGQVIDYYYGDLPLPIVEYVVNGTPHRVKGPEFKVSIYDPRDHDGKSNISLSDLFSRRRTGLEGATRETLPTSVTVYKAPLGAVDVAGIIGSIGDADALKQQATQIATRDNPLSALYPIGSMADVYYDPADPDFAYVQRSLGVTVMDYIGIFIGIMFGVAGILMFVL